MKEKNYLRAQVLVAVVGVSITILTITFVSGQFLSEKVSKSEFSVELKDRPRSSEIYLRLRGKASKESVIKIKGEIDSIHKDIKYIKQRQDYGFRELNRKLDRFFSRSHHER